MDDRILLQVSAFSGLAGAVLTQVLTGVFSFLNERRRMRYEMRGQLRAKKMEVAEHFYFVTGETMAILKKNVAFWKNRNNSRSEASLRFLCREMRKLDSQLAKVQAENWQHNLINLYFQVTLSQEEIIKANSLSHLLYLKILDIAEQLGKAEGAAQEQLAGAYNQCVFDLCAQYDRIYAMLAADIRNVRQELLITYR